MNIRDHVVLVSVKRVPEVDPSIVLFNHFLPSKMCKFAQVSVVLEQNLHQSVSIPTDLKDFVVCKIRSTIQHEAAHRQDEETRHKQTTEQRMQFEDFIRPGRAEPIAEQAEEKCLPPESVSGAVEQVDITSLFEDAKSKANINPAWKSDIVAATLASNVAGEYLAKDIPQEEITQAHQVSPGVYQMGNKLFIDVRKIIQPYIVEKNATLPANVQTARDGAVTTDPDLTNYQKSQGTVPTVPTVPFVPSVPTL